MKNFLEWLEMPRKWFLECFLLLDIFHTLGGGGGSNKKCEKFPHFLFFFKASLSEIINNKYISYLLPPITTVLRVKGGIP